MKKFKICLLVLMTLSLTGCGNSNYIMENKKPVENKATGQVLQKDILCKPEDKELDKLYDKYKDQTKIKYGDLPKCSDFNLSSNKSDGIWEGIFVKPLAFVILKLKFDALIFVSLIYFVNLAFNVIFSFLTKKIDFVFAIGLILFVLCDINVAFPFLIDIFNLVEPNIIVKIVNSSFNFIWFFYLPSQVLISTSLYLKSLKQ